MNKQVDMQAFVGVDFDCEFKCEDYSGWDVSNLDAINDQSSIDLGARKYVASHVHEYYEYDFCRPRINKPQVLDDWSFVPDGLVWRSHNYKKDITSEQLRNFEDWTLNVTQFFFACIGAEPDYKEWADANGVPVVEVIEL